MSASMYRRSSVDHLIWITFEKANHVSTDFYLAIEYEVPSESPPGPPPKSLQLEEVIVSRLVTLPEPLRWRCHVHFEYDEAESQSYETVFPLPIPLDRSRGRAPFDEIRGVRGVKLAENAPDSVEYSFALERIPNHGVYLTLDYSLLQPAVLETPRSALRIAVGLANQLILPVSKE